jgi:transketolase
MTGAASFCLLRLFFKEWKLQIPDIDRLRERFPFWEKAKDIVDQYIDISLNLAQSGHPGGSRSKVHLLLATCLSGAMRFDIRAPWKRFGDRFILGAGHANPAVYAMLALFNEAMRTFHGKVNHPRYALPRDASRVLFPEDLLTLRQRGGLPGHAEMAGKTLFFKFNTGPSGHGGPAAAGQALALRHAGAWDVKVFVLEGEGGLTAGSAHETMNSAWGLGLSNLIFLVDWNDFGIDDQPVHTVVPGKPDDWFGSHGWRTAGTMDGEDWGTVTAAILEIACDQSMRGKPGMIFSRNRKGRGYGIFDNRSHGSVHAFCSPAFWETKRFFTERYSAEFEGYGKPGPDDRAGREELTRSHLETVTAVLRRDDALLEYLADTLADLGDSVPEKVEGFRIDTAKNPLADPDVIEATRFPASLFAAPGTRSSNRQGFGDYGAYLNALGRKKHGRPLFLACAADLADSINVSGFAKDYAPGKGTGGEPSGGAGSSDGKGPEEIDGFGVYCPDKNPQGALLPQEITEFTNASIMAGLACVNFADNPEEEFAGYCGVCATYGSFSYLKYGPMRLLSQVDQDSPFKTGKVIWVAGHSGPETAEDSRTHFGIFAPAVSQLFPEGRVINLHPFEHNEVAPALAAALRSDVPIIALHLTRPPITIPDRKALGIPSHFEAAKGAYTVRDFNDGAPPAGTVVVQGTSAMTGVLEILPELPKSGLNVKIVCAVSRELFLLQPEEYRESVLGRDASRDATYVTNGARIGMACWKLGPVADRYALSSDWDDRWRTGGSIPQVLDDARLTPEWILEGIRRFAGERVERLGRS